MAGGLTSMSCCFISFFPFKKIKTSSLFSLSAYAQWNIRPHSVYSMGNESSDEMKSSLTRKKLTFEFYFIFSCDMLRRQYIFLKNLCQDLSATEYTENGLMQCRKLQNQIMILQWITTHTKQLYCVMLLLNCLRDILRSQDLLT